MGPPRASRSTTVVLIVALFVVIIVTGALATIAVLMTRQPDLPLGAAPPRRLATDIHFAPVTGTRPAPCPGEKAVLDEAGTTCYQVAAGVTVTSVIKVETIPDEAGMYAVRVVLAPESRERLASLTREALNQLLAVVVQDRVVTAPRVAQAITEDSLSIAGLSKEDSDALVHRLLGTGGPGTAGSTGVPTAGAPTGVASPPGGRVPLTSSQGTQGTQATRAPGATQTSSAGRSKSAGELPSTTPRSGRTPDARFPSCQKANAAGYGPYTKGVHQEYDWYVDGDRDGVACERDDLT